VHRARSGQRGAVNTVERAVVLLASTRTQAERSWGLVFQNFPPPTNATGSPARNPVQTRRFGRHVIASARCCDESGRRARSQEPESRRLPSLRPPRRHGQIDWMPILPRGSAGCLGRRHAPRQYRRTSSAIVIGGSMAREEALWTKRWGAASAVGRDALGARSLPNARRPLPNRGLGNRSRWPT